MSDYEIKTLPPYLAIGLVCNVSYTDFRPLQDTIEEMQKRVDELNLVEAIPNRLASITIRDKMDLSIIPFTK
ncbi:hypothetical protein [Bacillus sp. JCM 19041]|uniref:hypothetical protein n=1 Tax=Bacillus sp. JCM 19041 TaxID=1460637 RepID=UPI0006D0CFF7